MRTIFPRLLVSVTLFSVASHAGAASPAILCESGKLKTAGKYAACLLGAESKARKAGGSPDISGCSTALSAKWQTSESKGAGMCPNGTGDEQTIRDLVDACAGAVADELAGEPPSGCSAELEACELDLGSCDAAHAACEADLAACLVDCPTASVPRTGQTMCYDASGNPIACAGTGQDGELQLGAPRSFVDNGDGTITDNVTGLVWESLVDDGSLHDRDNAYTWSEAFAKVAALNSAGFAGHSDWRLPNLNELETIRNLGAINPAAFAVFDIVCGGSCPTYWSSSYASPTAAWALNMFRGHITDTAKSSTLHVRAVRGG